MTVQDLLSSSENLAVTTPEMVALRFLVERIGQWRERARAALANDSIAEIHRLIALLKEKPANSDGEMTAAADQSRLLSSLRSSPEFGITVIISDCYKALHVYPSVTISPQFMIH